MHYDDHPIPTGLILLSHPELNGLTLKDMIDALPPAYKGLPYQPVELETIESARRARDEHAWVAARRILDAEVRAKVAPLLEKHPDYTVLYYGSSPVPLTIELGFLLHTWNRVEIVPHHHGTRRWGFGPPPDQPAHLAKLDLPEEKDRTRGEAIVRVSTSHRVEREATRRAVPESLVEIDIALEHPAEDAFTSFAEMEEVAQAFRTALDVLGDRFTGIQRVHLFASVQPGMALLLGAQISKTMHPPVQTYQYMRKADDERFHVPALLVNGPPRPEPAPLTPQEEEQAKRDRERLEKDLERMKGFAKRELQEANPSWIPRSNARAKGHPSFVGGWLTLPLLGQTPLLQTKVDVEARSVDDSFRLIRSGSWQIDDRWLRRLRARLSQEDERRRALRMLVLHELAHRGSQGLTTSMSRGVGRFPKVLEEIDYHADAWGMLYEHALSALDSPTDVERPAAFVQGLIRVATETMWAFDDDDEPLHEIQIRRLHRYLMWYWQFLLLERGEAQGEPMALDAVLTRLAERPIIELAGPAIMAHDERVFFSLDPRRVHTPELAIYHEGKLLRDGARLDFSILDLLEGVRMRSGEKILDALRPAAEKNVR
jgi:SMODS-associated and fused to various effectors sensor domain